MDPPGRSAKIMALLAELGTFPMEMPPNRMKSLEVRSLALPKPMTTSRATSRPAGRTSSSAEPLLPVNFSDAAARVTRSPVGASTLRAAAPNWSFSSQNRMRTPLDGGVNEANPSFGPSAMHRFLSCGCRQPATLLHFLNHRPQLNCHTLRELPFDVHFQHLCLGPAMLCTDQ